MRANGGLDWEREDMLMCRILYTPRTEVRSRPSSYTTKPALPLMIQFLWHFGGTKCPDLEQTCSHYYHQTTKESEIPSFRRREMVKPRGEILHCSSPDSHAVLQIRGKSREENAATWPA